jgi:Fe-S cluster assembly protein SufD
MKEPQHARAQPPMPSALSPVVLTERAKGMGEPSWVTDARLEALASYRSIEAPKGGRTDLAASDVEARALRSSAARAPRREHAHGRGFLHLPLSIAAREHPDLVRDLLTAPVPDADKWARLARAVWSDGSLLYVERGTQLAEPIQVSDHHAPEGAAVRDLVVLDRGAGARVVARNGGAGPGALSLESIEVEVRDNAQLSLATVQDLSPGATLLTDRRLRLRRDARLTWVDGQLGAGTVVARNETRLEGQGAALGLLGAFFGGAGQHFDVTTSAFHAGPNTSSQLDMKGALLADAYAVNYSIVNIGPEARNASGHQHQETLLLSDKARADAIPKLDVENNDVSASHGASVGQVDPEQVFYLESRGFSEIAARRLIVEGFFEPLLRAIPVDDVREELRNAIATRLKE